MTATDVFVQHPWLAALLWVALHAADYLLTIVGIVHSRRVADQVSFESYELNPLFRKPVEEVRWLSPRFLLSLVIIALLFWFIFGAVAQVAQMAEFSWLLYLVGALLGLLVFTRLVLIAGHLSNIWMFRELHRDPEALTGKVRYGLIFSLKLSAVRFASFGGVLAAAAVVTANSWLVGGAVGCGLFVAKHALTARRGAKR